MFIPTFSTIFSNSVPQDFTGNSNVALDPGKCAQFSRCGLFDKPWLNNDMVQQNV